jgi:GTPase
MNKEKVFLVVVDFRRKRAWPPEDVCQEMQELAAACGGEVVQSMICRADRPTAACLISEGRVRDIAAACQAGAVDTVVFSHELKGSQQRNIEEILQLKTIDRTQLILDIFAKHAKSQEGKMQVELAQLEYLLPRLVGKGVELSRLGGGIGTLGPGETKLEVDRRRIQQRITRFKRELKKVSANRRLKRKQRMNRGVPLVCLVGYTNAGKSTLLNALTDAQQTTRDGLFTTLDSLSRQLTLGNNQKVVFSDTVGFMHELPHRLIEAFRATLEEVQEADLLLHVLDVSHQNFRNFYDAVLKVLLEIEAQDKPAVVVLNKIDKIQDDYWVKDVVEGFPAAVAVSAREKKNIDQLLEKIIAALSPQMVDLEVDIPMTRMDIMNAIYQNGKVRQKEYFEDHIHIKATVPVYLANKLSK